MRRYRRAKIVATVGPASASPEMLKGLFRAGVDTFRLNFSHGAQEDHARVHAAIRALEKEVGRPIGILLDLRSQWGGEDRHRRVGGDAHGKADRPADDALPRPGRRLPCNPRRQSMRQSA